MVPLHEADELFSAGQRAEVVVTEGFGHSGVLRSPVALEACLAFWVERKAG